MKSVTKTKQDKDATDGISAIYAENNTELSWSIELGVDCDKNQIRQLCDWSYRSGLCQKWN